MNHPWIGLLALFAGYAIEWGVFWFYLSRSGPIRDSLDPPPKALPWFTGANCLSAAGSCIASAFVPITTSHTPIHFETDFMLLALWFGVAVLIEFLFWFHVLLGSRVFLFRALTMSNFANYATLYLAYLGYLNTY